MRRTELLRSPSRSRIILTTLMAITFFDSSTEAGTAALPVASDFLAIDTIVKHGADDEPRRDRGRALGLAEQTRAQLTRLFRPLK